MLSKGGKISYVCSSCKSPHIINTKKGVTIQGVNECVSIPGNHCVCVSCGAYSKWSARLKVKTIAGDNYDGIVTVDDYQRLSALIGKIAKVKSPESKPSKPNVEEEYVHKPFVPPIKRGEQTELGIDWSPRGREDLTHWTHRPEDFGVWVAYNSWRFKDAYDIMLKDGTIEKMCYPNADKFSNGNGCHSEYDVIAVRLCDYDDVKDSWRAGGETKEESDEYRARRNSSMFAGEESTRESWKDVKPVLFDPETRQLINDDITTMERAHELFSSESAKANLLIEKENQLSDEELLTRYFPTYIPELSNEVVKLKLHGTYGQHGNGDSFQVNLPEEVQPDIGRGFTQPNFFFADIGPDSPNVIEVKEGDTVKDIMGEPNE